MADRGQALKKRNAFSVHREQKVWTHVGQMGLLGQRCGGGSLNKGSAWWPQVGATGRGGREEQVKGPVEGRRGHF